MSHSITVLQIHSGGYADELLEGLAERLDVAHIWQDAAGRAQLWLQFDPERAFDTVVAALDETAADWRDHLSVTRPHEEAGQRVERTR
jgi:hypothetical protein